MACGTLHQLQLRHAAKCRADPAAARLQATFMMRTGQSGQHAAQGTNCCCRLAAGQRGDERGGREPADCILRAGTV